MGEVGVSARSPTGPGTPTPLSDSAPPPHIAGFLVVVNVVDAAGQPEVGDLHRIVLCHQYVSGSQVPVDALGAGQGLRFIRTRGWRLGTLYFPVTLGEASSTR